MPRHNGKASVDIKLDEIEDEILEWVRDTFGPDDVFHTAELTAWAIHNGFTESAQLRQ